MQLRGTLIATLLVVLSMTAAAVAAQLPSGITLARPTPTMALNRCAVDGEYKTAFDAMFDTFFSATSDTIN